MPKSVFHRASCSKSGTFLRIHLWIFPVFTPSSPKWSVQMCQGSRTEAAISVHTSAALMMMPLDLLCSAIWALDPIWLQKGGIPRHAFLVRLRLHSRNFMYSSTFSVFCFSACTHNSSSKVKREHENVMKTVAGFQTGTLIFSLHYTRTQQVPVAEPPSDWVMDADNHNEAELQHVVV